MATKYPIVLVHGIAAKKLRILNASGKIGNKLEEAGNAVFIAHRQKTKALPSWECLCFLSSKLSFEPSDAVQSAAGYCGDVSFLRRSCKQGVEVKLFAAYLVQACSFCIFTRT